MGIVYSKRWDGINFSAGGHFLVMKEV